MKKAAIFSLCVLLLLSLLGCGKKEGVKNTVKGNMNTYYEMDDGTWTCGGYTYKYRLEIPPSFTSRTSKISLLSGRIWRPG